MSSLFFVLSAVSSRGHADCYALRLGKDKSMSVAQEMRALVRFNALEPATFEALMGNDRADMVFTDPPYNVSIRNTVKTGGKTGSHREFAMASGEMTVPEFTNFLITAMVQLKSWSRDGSPSLTLR